MKAFMKRHAGKVTGVLSGFDRLRLRGTKRLLSTVGGMYNLLWQEQVLLKNFKAYALHVTDRIRRATERIAEGAGQAVRYLASSAQSKEDLARRIATEQGMREGLICMLSCGEPCRSYAVRKNRQTRQLELDAGLRKCLHYYHYYYHPQARWSAI